MNFNPHANAKTYSAGSDLQQAKAALILVHGRGSSAASMLSLFTELELDSVNAIAPEANGNTWYPYSFLVETEKNQPYLSSALKVLGDSVYKLNQAGIPDSKIVFLGFSQGACLISEYAARHPKKYGGIIILTGGLIGSEINLNSYSGSFLKTPVFIGTSDPDSHVPLQRVQQTAEVFKNLGAEIDLRIYAGMSHTINEEEMKIVKEIIKKVSDN